MCFCCAWPWPLTLSFYNLLSSFLSLAPSLHQISSKSAVVNNLGKSGYGYRIPNIIRIAPEIKRSLPWFTGYSFIKFPWNPSITFSAIRLAILNTCPDPGSGLWSGFGSKRNQIVQTPTAIDPLNFIESLHDFFRYPAEIEKSGVNPASGSSSKPNEQLSRLPWLSTH